MVPRNTYTVGEIFMGSRNQELSSQAEYRHLSRQDSQKHRQAPQNAPPEFSEELSRTDFRFSRVLYHGGP